MALKDLTGQKFGRLTVIERAPTYISQKGGHVTKWKCLCECGKEVVKSSYDLRHEDNISCGCYKKEHPYFKDITGWKMWEHGFPQSRVKVLYRTKQNKIKNWMWMCECQCEKKTHFEVSGGNLLSGHSLSCGCLMKDLIKQRKKKNKYEFFDDYVVGYTQKGTPFYVDLQDYDKIKDIYWFETTEWTNMKRLNGVINGKRVRQHVYLGFQNHDHIDKNELNNRRSNLRKCSQRENNFNKGIKCTNTSGIIGVHWCKERSLWLATLKIDDVYKLHKRFKEKDDAIKARLEAEAKYFGEYAPQIDLFGQYGIEKPKIKSLADEVY